MGVGSSSRGKPVAFAVVSCGLNKKCGLRKPPSLAVSAFSSAQVSICLALDQCGRLLRRRPVRRPVCCHCSGHVHNHVRCYVGGHAGHCSGDSGCCVGSDVSHCGRGSDCVPGIGCRGSRCAAVCGDCHRGCIHCGNSAAVGHVAEMNGQPVRQYW